MTDEITEDMTREEYRESLNKAPQPKVVAATVGAGVGAAMSTITVWIAETALTMDIPDGVELALGVVITAGLTFASGYFKRS